MDLKALKKRLRQGSPIRLGLTGGLASGKSTALEAFRAQGWQTASADTIVHEIYAEEGMDVAELRQKAKNSPKALKELEAWVHPRVRRRIRSLLRDTRKNIVVEVPLLFESPLAKDFHFNIFVFAPDGERRKRANKRGMGSALFQKLNLRQWSCEKKAAHADLVLLNLSQDSLSRQIKSLSQMFVLLKRESQKKGKP